MTGKDHVRIRKIMNPGFAAGQLKSFLPHFLSSAQKVCLTLRAVKYC